MVSDLFAVLIHETNIFQVLRQNIQDEYREVVERRVFTGMSRKAKLKFFCLFSWLYSCVYDQYFCSF